MAGLGLKTVAYMAEKFPDRWMEKIPYYRPREEESHSRSRSRRHSHRQPRRSRDLDDDEDYYDDRYASDDYEQGRRHHRSNSADGYRFEDVEPARRRSPYNPAEYARAERNGHYAQPSVYNPRAGMGSPVVTTNEAADPRRPTSGPMPGYVPYAHVYQRQPQYSQAQSPTHYQPARQSRYDDDPYARRSQEDRYIREYQEEPRRVKRSGSHRRSTRHSNRGYDSEGEVRYPRRSRRH